MGINEIVSLFRDGPASEKVLLDVKGILDKSAAGEAGLSYWRL